MRELIDNEIGGPLSALGPLLLCGGLSATAFQGHSSACRWASRQLLLAPLRAPWPAGRRKTHCSGGALSITEAASSPAPFIGKSAGSGRLIRRVGRWAISSRAESSPEHRQTGPAGPPLRRLPATASPRGGDRHSASSSLARPSSFVRSAVRSPLRSVLGSRRRASKAARSRVTAPVAALTFCRHTYVTQR
jgi:hypothetical protein